MDRPIFINYVLGLETATMRQIMDVVREPIVEISASNSCTFRARKKSLDSGTHRG